jgi:hypothetical protein
MEGIKRRKVKNWKGIAKVRRNWRNVAEKGKIHKGL